jgi:type IV secretion system protein VirB6
MDNWINFLGQGIDAMVFGYVSGVADSLSVALRPLLVTALTVYWMILGWSIARGEVNDPVSAIIWNAFKLSFILTVALGVGVYNNEIATAADGLRDGMASVFGGSVARLSGGAADTTTTTATVWSTIQLFDTRAGQLTKTFNSSIGTFDIPGAFALLLFVIGQQLLILAAMFIAILTKVFMAFFLAVGPIFIACAAFRPTQRFFDAWVGMIVNTIVLCWIGLFILGFAMFIATDFARQVQNNWANTDFYVFGGKYLCMCLIFVVMLLQAPSWAAALTGGASLGLGGQMVGAATGAVVGRMLSRGGSSAGGAQGGSTLRAAGRGLDAAAGYGGRAALNAARYTRQAAYKMATRLRALNK